MRSPELVIHVVSATIEARTSRCPAGSVIPDGPTRKRPAPRSSSVPKTLGESRLGRQSHSTLPVGATSAATSPSERNARTAIGGEKPAGGQRGGGGAQTDLVPGAGPVPPPPAAP